jgi:3-oxoacyl-[acyl-carrier-protein] synthase III
MLSTDGAFVDDLGVRAPGTEFGVRPGGADAACAPGQAPQADFFPRMVGQSVILQASRKMAAVCASVLERNGLGVGDVRWLVPHQANANLLAQVARALRFDAEAGGLVSILADYGNTSSAAMGMAIDALRREGRAQGGDYVLLPAFGAGFTWGAGLCRVVPA